MARKPKTEATLKAAPQTGFTTKADDETRKHYGTAFIGGIEWTSTTYSSPKTPEETAIITAVRQLELWRERGYHSQLRSTDAGWLAQIDADDDNTVTLRFNSNYQPTFVAAVQKAMEVIK